MPFIRNVRLEEKWHTNSIEKYEKTSGRSKEWGIRFITELNLNKSEHVLDLGNYGDSSNTDQLQPSFERRSRENWRFQRDD